jgi:flagellin
MSRINTNVPSLVAARIYANNNKMLATSLERLSTGLRINTGKDDPAGLIGSERLRSEMTAIGAAIDNARRADNMVSVAEGGLQEVSSLLLELENLVAHSASEAGLSSDEVAANQLQIDAILDSINRVANSTEFSGKKLLNGALAYSTSGLTTGATASAVTDLRVNSTRVPPGGTRSVVVAITSSAQTAQVIYAGSATGAGTTTLEIAGRYGTEVVSFASGTSADNVATAINQSKDLTGVSATVSGTGASARIKINSTDYGSDAFVSVQAISGTFAVTGGDDPTRDSGVDVGATINGVEAISNGLDVSLRTSTLNVDMSLASAFATQTANAKTFHVTGGGADFSIAPTLGLNATASVGLNSVTTGSLGSAVNGFLSTLGSGQTNQLSSENYDTAQRIIREAQTQVASLRGRLGAFQKNTLASTINSLQVTLENVTAAESAIRDTDFAEETSKLTRAQILVSAATSALQLSNAAPQSVLSLIR